MKRFRPHDSHAEHPNVIPLVDVMLCLIVFYMLAAKIGVNTGADPDIQVPVAKFLQQLDMTGQLVLNVRQSASGDPIVSGLLDPKSGEFNEVSGTVQTIDTSPGEGGLSQLDRILRAVQQRKPDMKLVLRTDETVTYGTFMPVLISVNQAKVRNIFHNVKPPEAK
jgi:biopolymer transport protein ExbD